jgi:DSF synthase
MLVRALDTDATKRDLKYDAIYPTTDYATKSTVHQLFSTTSRNPESDNPFFDTRFDVDSSTFWLSLRPDCPPKFTLELIQAFRTFQSNFANHYQNRTENDRNSKHPAYMVINSEIADTFNLGGDLPYFYSLIKQGDRKRLTEYATICVELIYQNSIAMGLPMTTIALVKGSAMGGGMETALAANVLVAERQATMGLPEVLFNMFPGMGAYQFLARRLSPVEAEKFILSGRTYGAEELFDMGIVDVLADEGQGEAAVNDYIEQHKKTDHAARALRSAINVADPVSRESLMSVVDIWVETALTLDERDLNRMNYLIRAQQKRGF